MTVKAFTLATSNIYEKEQIANFDDLDFALYADILLPTMLVSLLIKS